MIRLTLSAACLSAFCASAVFAQGDPMAMAHKSAANQLGIMEYCQSKGDVGTDAVSAQRDAVARLPAATVDTSAEEAAGKSGSLMNPNGQAMTLDSVASAQHVSVADLCKRLGDSAVQANAMTKQMGAAGMPQMPAGMPRMPAGMPQRPGMPAPPK